jgi:hypothetical protein
MKMNLAVPSPKSEIRRAAQAPLLLLLLLAGSLAAARADGFVYENASELQSDGDFDGDGRRDLLLVDKATGSCRIGYQLSAGSYTWASARASGIANATGLAIGKLNSTNYDSLALTGPDANRVNILDANDTTTAGLPDSLFLTALGPNVVAAVGVGGSSCSTLLDDLYVASSYNSPKPYLETLVCNNGLGDRTALGDNTVFFLRERANPVLIHTNRAPRLAVLERNTGSGTDSLSIFDTSGGSVALVAQATNLPNPSEYVTGQFDGTNPYTQFLVYLAGTTTFNEYQVSESPPGTYNLAASGPFTLTNVIDRLFVVTGTSGLRLLAFDTNGISATVYAFDGVHQPVSLEAFTADPGEHFTGAGILGGSGFMAYSAPLGQTTSANFKQWNWIGAHYVSGPSGSLPRASAYSAAGNVMQFQFEPFVNNNPILLRINNAGDWATTPTFSGSPRSISVKTETFAGSTEGLVANASPSMLGAAHSLAAFALANQYRDQISLFGFTPPAGDRISDVTISPPAGLYPTAIQLQFVAANSGDAIHYRIGAANWTNWSPSAIVRLFTNVTVQYYGQPSALSAAKSAIKSAAYSFTQPPATLDSNGDGVPDYVKIALGLDPNGASDSDGDGYSDLEEIICGTDPLDAASVPTNCPHLDEQAVFDLQTTPLPWDGFSNTVSLSATGTVLRAYDMQGSLLSMATISNLYPAALLTNIIIVAEDRLAVCATEPHYDILTTNVDTRVGCEMVGLVPIPAPQMPVVSYIYGTHGGDIVAEANGWIAAARAAFNNLPRATLTNSLSVTQTLAALLFEQETAQILRIRGTNWWNNLTLFPFRARDAGRINPSSSNLLSLETGAPNLSAYKLQTMFGTISNAMANSSDTNIANLRAVAQDVYRVDSAFNNTNYYGPANPAALVSPVEEIRYFLWNGTLDTNYLVWAATTNLFAPASSGASAILASVVSRPTTNVTLLVRADTFSGACRPLDLSPDVTFALLDPSGVPFVFPSSFQLLPGSAVQILGYTDVGTACGYPAIEVVSAGLSSVPIATDATDSDHNGLIDAWEIRFFGAVGLVGANDDSDGDGYTNLQEMLAGSDPLDPNSVPGGSPAILGRSKLPPGMLVPPVVTLVRTNGQIELHFHWPPAYIEQFNFGVRHAAALDQPFTDLPLARPEPVAGDEYKQTVTLPPDTAQFFYLTFSWR